METFSDEANTRCSLSLQFARLGNSGETANVARHHSATKLKNSGNCELAIPQAKVQAGAC